MQGIRVQRKCILLVIVCLISLSLRLWLLDKRWINPDEGAHLMDAALALEGKIPLVDYESRQPLYVYALAGFLKVFGPSYTSGRLLTVTCSMLTGLVIFFMSRLLFDKEVALLACAMYWVLPLELVNSPIVKTEPLAVLLTSLSLYAAVRFERSRFGLWLVLAGLCAALGHYVRESVLIIPLVVLGFLLFLHGWRIREVATSFGFFLVGYGGVLLSVMSYYSRFLGPIAVLKSDLTPFRVVISTGEKLLSRPVVESASSNLPTPQAVSMSWDLYYHYVRSAFELHSFLLIGMVFSFVLFLQDLVIRDRGASAHPALVRRSILYLWVLFLFLAYTYYFYVRGFFIDYFRELFPPLVILFSAWVLQWVPSLREGGNLERFIVGAVGIGASLFFLQSHYSPIYGTGFQASLAIALFTLFVFAGVNTSPTHRVTFILTLSAMVGFIFISREPPLKPFLSGSLASFVMIGATYLIAWVLLQRHVRPSVITYAKFIVLSLVVASCVVSLSFAADRLTLAYDSVWSPESVQEGAAYLKTHTRPESEVISGAVIWEFQAGRKPFQTLTHPLGLAGQSQEEKEKLRLSLFASPPDVIILDGYTERTYSRQVPSLMELIETRYRFTGNLLAPARYPIKVYQLLRKEPTLLTTVQ